MRRRETPERRPTLQHRFEYLLLRVLELMARTLPRRAAMGLARLVGRFAFSVLRIRRRVTFENLRIALPEASVQELHRVAREAYVNLALMGMELLRARSLDRDDVLERVDLDRESEALFHMAMREQRGAVVVSGHYGNWEILAARIAALGYPSVAIVQQQRNPLMDRDLKEIRRHLGYEMVGRGAAVRGVLKTLSEGGAVMIVADQDAGTRDPMFVEFFGRAASAYRGPAMFAARSGAPLIGAWIHREDGRFRARFERLDQDALEDLPPGSGEELRVPALTRAYMAWLERVILQDPTQYLWLHRRWKSRPAGETA